MTCDEALEMLSAWLDGEITPEEAAQLAAHLDECAECRAVEAQLQMTDEELRMLWEEPPAGLSEQIMQAVAREAAAKKHRRWSRWAMPAVAAALVLLVSGTFFSRLAFPSTDSAAMDTAVSSDSNSCSPVLRSTEEESQPEISSYEAAADEGVATDDSADAAPAETDSVTTIQGTALQALQDGQVLADSRQAMVICLSAWEPALDGQPQEPWEEGWALVELPGAEIFEALCESEPDAAVYSPATGVVESYLALAPLES